MSDQQQPDETPQEAPGAVFLRFNNPQEQVLVLHLSEHRALALDAARVMIQRGDPKGALDAISLANITAVQMFASIMERHDMAYERGRRFPMGGSSDDPDVPELTA